MLKAVLFDFNGILVDDERIHMELFVQALAEHDIALRESDYFERYFTYSDRDLFTTIFRENRKNAKPGRIDKLIQKKNRLYLERIASASILYPGAKDTAEMFAEAYLLGIVSGALRIEIDTVLRREDLDGLFPVIVSAEDVSQGKPDPECYVVALNEVNNQVDLPLLPVQPSECLVIEDSPAGVESARSIGMRCIGIANTVDRSLLIEADLVYDAIGDIQMDQVRPLFGDTDRGGN